MLNSSWATLLRQLPADQHNQLMLRTANGTEIAVQDLVRIDFEFVIIRGRLSGSQDNGRVFILPYGNLDYVGVNRFVKDEEYNALFGSLVLADPEARAVTPPAATPSLAATKLTVPDATLQVIKPSRQGAPVKSSVLERFRTRNNPSIADE